MMLKLLLSTSRGNLLRYNQLKVSRSDDYEIIALLFISVILTVEISMVEDFILGLFHFMSFKDFIQELFIVNFNKHIICVLLSFEFSKLFFYLYSLFSEISNQFGFEKMLQNDMSRFLSLSLLITISTVGCITSIVLQRASTWADIGKLAVISILDTVIRYIPSKISQRINTSKEAIEVLVIEVIFVNNLELVRQ